MASRLASGDLVTEINVTPLVDVVLVLLVVLMVTATAMANRSIVVQVPRAKTGDSDATHAPLVVSVDAQGSLFVGSERVDEATLRTRARDAATRDAQAGAVLAADADARHQAVVHVLDLLRSEHVAKVSMVVRGDARPR